MVNTERHRGSEAAASRVNGLPKVLARGTEMVCARLRKKRMFDMWLGVKALGPTGLGDAGVSVGGEVVEEVVEEKDGES